MERSLGCVQSKKDLRDYRLVLTTQVLPETFELEPPKVLDQGSVGSCVAHSTATAVAKLYDKEFSRGWIYGRRDATDYLGSGMTIPRALKTAFKEGCVPNEFFDYNLEMMDMKNLVDENLKILVPLAMAYKIGSYARLYNNTEIKTALLKGLPVVIAVTVYDDYLDTDENNIIKVPTETSKSVGGHAVTLYGWNEKGFLLQNSWGTKYGKGGREILPYEYSIEEAYTIDEIAKDIVKPKNYTFREILMVIVKLLRKLFNKGE